MNNTKDSFLCLQISQAESDAISDEDISGLGNSADDEASSWQSRVSLDSHQGDADKADDSSVEDLSGDASSVVLEFKGVWFNFAAPPPSPKKKKLEFTRYYSH